ncbi:MAG: Capsular polysaccharide biosynthesis protein [uncultured bacterium]|nr:MAG: Capsular polysaccharide biosynthesis protein [uncultured bacterium]
MKELISIIVPVFNSENYLHRCIKSLINQSYKNIEITLIDDGSTDKSGKICDEYAYRNKRITTIHQKNSGPASARNTGIKNSKGEFIFFIDADDFIENEALNLLIKSFNQHKAEIIIGDFKKIKNGIIEQRHDISFSDDKLLNKQDLVDYSRLYLKKPNKYLLFAFSWGKLFKSLIIKNNNIFFNEKLHTFEDVAFNFDYLKYTNTVSFIKKTIYSHNVYENYSSATMTLGNNPNKLFGYRQALININNFLKRHIKDTEIKKEVRHAYISLTIIQLVRICGQINDHNKKNIFKIIQELTNNSYLKDSLKYYSPSKDDSIILPILLKLKLVQFIIFVCKYKANKRYKKLGK